MLAHHASSDEAHSLESSPSPQHEFPAPLFDEPNRWCIDVQYQIYRDAKTLNEKMVRIWLVTVERRVFTWSLHTVPEVHTLFTLHSHDWMAEEANSTEFLREFYASYVDGTEGLV